MTPATFLCYKPQVTLWLDKNHKLWRIRKRLGKLHGSTSVLLNRRVSTSLVQWKHPKRQQVWLRFWCNCQSGDGLVMMSGGGESSCARADHGIRITETSFASFVKMGRRNENMILPVIKHDEECPPPPPPPPSQSYSFILWIR